MKTDFIREKATVPCFCCLCATPIYVGDPVYAGFKNDEPRAAHDACVVRWPEKTWTDFDHDALGGQESAAISKAETGQ